MNNLINDPYLNDLKYFSDKLNYFLDSELYEILYEDNKDIQAILQKYLIQTARSSFSTQAKRIRPMLCYWLFRNFYLEGNFSEKLSNIKQSEKKIFEKMNKVAITIEILHSASLVVDDIEDDSKERRGQESLHVKYGMPQALNTANWMYFLALKYVPQNLKSIVMDTLFDCHIGQALDLSSKNTETTYHHFLLSENERWQFYERCAELKTSKLISLAFDCAKKLMNINKNDIIILENVFKIYGIIYQIFDDIKNFIPELNRDKLYEDLNSGMRSAVVLSFLDILNEDEKIQMNNELINNCFKEYFLNHAKKFHALEKCFYKASYLLHLNSIQLDSIHFNKDSREYLSEIIEKPFDEIKKKIFSMIHLKYNKSIVKENYAL